MTTTAPQLGVRAGPIEATHVTGRRVVATLIDGFIFGVAYWLLALAFGDLRTEGEAANWVSNLPAWASVVYGLFVIGYYIVLEGYLGQTVGKMATGIKVVSETTGATPESPRPRSARSCGSSTACSATPWRSSRRWRRPSGNGWAIWPPAPWSSASSSDPTGIRPWQQVGSRPRQRRLIAMKLRRLGQATLGLAGGYLAALAATRRWHQHWGATDEEITKPLPGDDLIPAARLDSTHAITVHAPADRIWPWLAQMGYEDRAGSYSYDLFEQSIGRNLYRIDPDIPPPGSRGHHGVLPGGADDGSGGRSTPMPWCCGRSPPKARRSTRLGRGVTTMWPGAGRSCSNRWTHSRPGCWSGCG